MQKTINNQKAQYSFLHPPVVALILAILCVMLHHSALSGGWRYDDGPHLHFVSQYSPWQYFFVPEIMREQSWANFTPWNAFFYETGLPFFGLNPLGHYVHLLLVLWLTAVATFFLLRLWLSPLAAMAGGGLFLAMPITGAIGQMLMTGHYAYGLLFSVCSLYFFAQSLRKENITLAVIAAVLYACACWSKELYVPLIGLIVLLPVANWKKRLAYALPCVLTAIIYTTYRLIVFSGVGGYGTQSQTGGFNLMDVTATLLLNLTGHIYFAYVLIVLIVLSACIAILFDKRTFNVSFLLGAWVVIFFPIIMMILRGDVGNALSDRLLYFISWSLAVCLAWLVDNSKPQLFLLLLAGVFLGMSQQNVIQIKQHESKLLELQNAFFIEGKPHHIMLPADFNAAGHDAVGYLVEFRKAAVKLGQHTPPTLLHDEKEMMQVHMEDAKNIYTFNAQCQCLHAISTQALQQRIHQFRAQLSAGKKHEIAIHVEIDDAGQHRRRLSWQFESSGVGTYYFYYQHHALALPPRGTFEFGKTGFLKEKDIAQFYVRLVSPDGWIVQTPILSIGLSASMPSISNQVSWRGTSATEFK